VRFTWLPGDQPGARPRTTVVKTLAQNWPMALSLALRAIALDKSIPDTATVRSIKL
jgi:hypothetical protein